jgi:hypothetical protein
MAAFPYTCTAMSHITFKANESYICADVMGIQTRV